MRRSRLFVVIAVATLAVIDIGPVTLVHAQSPAVSFDLTLDHVALSVPDIDASVAWYAQMFGFKEVRRVAYPEGLTQALIQHGGVRIELFQIPGAASLPLSRRNPTEDFRTHGVKHFGFQVQDVRAAVFALKAKGAKMAREVEENPRSIFAFVSDNAGNAIELIQRKQ